MALAVSTKAQAAQLSDYGITRSQLQRNIEAAAHALEAFEEKRLRRHLRTPSIDANDKSQLEAYRWALAAARHALIEYDARVYIDSDDDSPK